MSLAYRCEVCSGKSKWSLTRIGDVATTWACRDHLDMILERLQRDHEVTRIEVVLTAKAHEWAEISRTLGSIE